MKIGNLSARAVIIWLCAIVFGNALTMRAQTMVYVSNADSREIYVLKLDEKNGSLKIVQQAAVTGMVMPLAISPDHKFLFASLRSEPFSVSSFAIDPQTGKLSPLKTGPLADNMANLATDRTGHFLLAASYFGDKISVNAISPAGEVAEKPLAVISTGKNAHAVVTDLSNKFVFVSNLGDDQILQYRFDAQTGALTPNSPPAVTTKKGAGPRHFALHPNGRLIFGINELDATVNVYRLSDSGTLTPAGSVSVKPAGVSGGAPAAADLHLTPDGRFLYASERTSSTITAFRVDVKEGRLEPIGSYPTETQPRSFNIDPEGKYLVAAGQKSNGLSIYKINRRTGELKQLSHLEVGKNPNWVEIIKLPEEKSKIKN